MVILHSIDIHTSVNGFREPNGTEIAMWFCYYKDYFNNTSHGIHVKMIILYCECDVLQIWHSYLASILSFFRH